MKLQKKMLFFVLLAIMLSSVSLGAIKYGKATIQKGNVVIVREGRMYLYTKTNNPVTLFQNDTIRTLKNTSLVLFNPDQHKVILGSNAIMQLKKWKKKKQQGTIRMLFGKFRARTASLRKRSSLNLRTTTATIGIKGSLGDGATNPDFTMLNNKKGDMFMTNNSGQEFDIPTGQIGFNVDGKNQKINLKVDEDYDADKSEDEMETSDTDQLDTEDSKEVDIPPEIRDAIDDNIVEVVDARDFPEETEDDDLRFSGVPDLDDERESVQDSVNEIVETINATITIED